jgi:hypothetical protein
MLLYWFKSYWSTKKNILPGMKPSGILLLFLSLRISPSGYIGGEGKDPYIHNLSITWRWSALLAICYTYLFPNLQIDYSYKAWKNKTKIFKSWGNL